MTKYIPEMEKKMKASGTMSLSSWLFIIFENEIKNFSDATREMFPIM
jgi:hypothetical protein